jgi:cellobionic acid phosphorylase
MIPGENDKDLLQRGQLPVFIPNYYRGAYKQFPKTAGRSSQLFNTGTVHWIFRCLIDGLFGLKGDPEGLSVNPQLPEHWNEAKVVRNFRGAEFHIEMKKVPAISQIQVLQDGQLLDDNLVKNFKVGNSYKIEVRIPY